MHDAVCAAFFSCGGARGHGTADLLTEENDNHDLRGKLQLIVTAETEQSDGVYIPSKEHITSTGVIIQSLLLHSRALSL